MFRDAFDREESLANTLTGNGTVVKPPPAWAMSEFALPGGASGST
jgi:hypothetical protein